MNDANRSVATLAVSTLLKTVEVSRYSLFFSKSSIRIDSLLTRISSYMNEIDDEQKGGRIDLRGFTHLTHGLIAEAQRHTKTTQHLKQTVIVFYQV